MFAYTIRRLVQMIPLLFAASVVIFALLALQPGDPLDELRQNNPNLTAEQLEQLRKAYGLDQPIYVRYFKWLGRALQGDLGQSRSYGVKAAEFVFGERLPRTLLLSGLAFAVALLIAIPVGIFSAVRQYSTADYVITFMTFIGFSTPVFFLGIILLYLFTVVVPERTGLPALPTGLPSLFWSDVTSGSISFFSYVGTWATHLILPVMTLALIQMASWTRYMRASLLEVLGQDFIRTARAKGLAERKVLYKHALRNALIPIVTLVGLAVPGVLGGAIITENIFSYPGMGRTIFESLLAKDYNVAMAALAMLAVLTALFNLIADLLYAVVDPRIRYS
ncbi:Dipeptide transport system permease protein DppB [Calidithermus terrae]|uniref:Dipeptide transport system permease protein DppB n=1 Tax=Calidithermus terrae TaxID=1408545 RepID=A0A399ECL9_9DEIN|nr:ABC transporter permease [Calidithermus terrae]RIH81253.1 Dipeptide transport system permease protein DppB [Calidithermus terrae]